jgi:hypothetical protein
MKFLEMFTPVQKGDFGLTDEAIYRSIQYGGRFIPIWGGNQEHSTIDRLVSINGKTKFNEQLTVFSGQGIIISLDGSSGSMTFKEGAQEFALNHHAGFFKVREDSDGKINPEFFAVFYQKQLREQSLSEGSKTLTLDQLYGIRFDIPDFIQQTRVMKTIRPILELRHNLDVLITQQIDKIFEKQIVEI